MVGTVGNKGLNAHRYERRTSVRRFLFVLPILYYGVLVEYLEHQHRALKFLLRTFAFPQSATRQDAPASGSPNEPSALAFSQLSPRQEPAPAPPHYLVSSASLRRRSTSAHPAGAMA